MLVELLAQPTICVSHPPSPIRPEQVSVKQLRLSLWSGTGAYVKLHHLCRLSAQPTLFQHLSLRLIPSPFACLNNKGGVFLVSSGITSRPVKSDGRRSHLLVSPSPLRQTPLPRRRREAMETRAEVVVSHRPARSTHDDGSLLCPWSGIRTLFSRPTEGPRSRLT